MPPAFCLSFVVGPLLSACAFLVWSLNLLLVVVSQVCSSSITAAGPSWTTPNMFRDLKVGDLPRMGSAGAGGIYSHAVGEWEVLESLAGSRGCHRFAVGEWETLELVADTPMQELLGTAATGNGILEVCES